MRHPRHWPHHHSPWTKSLPVKRQYVSRRFFMVFGTMFLLFGASLGIVLLVFWPGLEEALPEWGILPWAMICGIPLGFSFLAVVLGALSFRRFGSPLAEVMAAADAVAEGDLGVRVQEDAPGELGRLERSFNRMAANLQQLEQQRRNLTADVAHELRTPLHILQGNLEGLQDGVYQATPDQVEAMLEETRLLGRLVEDLQTLSLAEAGQLALHETQFWAADLLNDVVTSFTGQARQADVELRVEAAPDAGNLELQADPDRLEQVLSNLVANALRHTPAGGRIVLGAQPTPGGVRLWVADNGEGIPASDLPHIFDRFWRGDPARTRRGGTGSGLGLAIARQLVQAYGGVIRVESQPSSGTVFTIELPDRV